MEFRNTSPCVLEAATFFLGTGGYVQIGYQPELAEDERDGIKFSLRSVVVVNDKFLLLDKSEMQCLFELLNNFDETNFSCQSADFEIYAYTDALGDEHFELHKNATKINFTADILGRFMTLCPVFISYMTERLHLKSHFENLLYDAFDDTAKKCFSDGAHLEYLARCSNDRFVIELYGNFNIFFSMYCKNRRDNKINK